MIMKNRKLTHEALLELVNYDPDTGVMTWKKSKGGRRAGAKIGCPDRCGYMKTKINGCDYRISRLAFLYMTGRWPEPCVDHINRVRDDDRWCNLREVTHRENKANCNPPKRSGLPKGVYKRGRWERYNAFLQHKRKRYHLGTFLTPDEAHEAYKKKYFELFGEQLKLCLTTTS